jgi:hypothetical protein
LTAEKRWVIWKWETNKKGGRTKVPYRAKHPHTKAKSTNPATWSDYATAVAAAAAHADGIGFCLLGSGFAAFDLDDCRDPATGTIHPWAAALVKRAASYTEITVSGTGLRIIGYGDGPKVHRKLNVIDDVTVEPYRQAERYIVMTGDALGEPRELANIDTVIDEVVAELDGAASKDREPRSSDGGAKPSFNGSATEDIAPDDPRLAKLDSRWIALGFEGKGIEKYDGHRSRAVLAFACECVRAGIANEVIASCLMHWIIGEHIREQSNVNRALNRALERAQLFVKDSKLFEMNEQHSVLPIGGKTRVATWGDDPDFPGRQTIVRFSTFADFTSLQDKYRHTYQGKDKDGTPQTVTMGQGTWWIRQSGRRQYDGGMRFMPQRDEDVVNDVLNLWTGFAVAARKPEGKSGEAGCKLFLDHGRKIICSDKEEHYNYLIKREAFIAQRRTRSEIAVGLQTEVEGTGKGFWCRGMNRLYGVHAMEVLSADHIAGKHNPHLEKLLRLTADEALFALDPRHRNALYNLITEPRITVEPKFVDAYSAANHLNLDVISNAEHFLPVSNTARRLFLPTVSDARANDHEYFRKIDEQLRNGGYEALLYHLLYEMDIRDFNVRDVPKTDALAKQAGYSRKGLDLLVEGACNEAVVPCQHANCPGFSDCKGYEQRTGFDYFIDHHPDRDLARMGALTVKRRLAKEWGCITGDATRKQIQGVKMHGIMWPRLGELREKFVARHGVQKWLHPDESDWIGW